MSFAGIVSGSSSLHPTNVWPTFVGFSIAVIDSPYLKVFSVKFPSTSNVNLYELTVHLAVREMFSSVLESIVVTNCSPLYQPAKV